MVTVRGASRLSQAMSVTPAPADLAPAIMAGMDCYKDTYADGGAKSHQGKSVGAAKTAATSVSLTGIYSIAPQIMNQARPSPLTHRPPASIPSPFTLTLHPSPFTLQPPSLHPSRSPFHPSPFTL